MWKLKIILQVDVHIQDKKKSYHQRVLGFRIKIENLNNYVKDNIKISIFNKKKENKIKVIIKLF